jgi:hypothetical protein
MSFKKILSILILISGIALIAVSSYIKTQVEEGKYKVDKAQKQVNAGRRVFSVFPETKEIGKAATDSAQKKINQANQEIGQYANLVTWLKIGGISLIVIGAGTFFIFRKKKMPLV